MKVKILYKQYLDGNGKNYEIGGVETYIHNLSLILKKNNFLVEIFQFSNENFVIQKNEAKITGIKSNKIFDLVKAASIGADYSNDLLIFATDFDICKTLFKKTIAIQHGIGWDIPSLEYKNYFENMFSILKNTLRVIVKYNRYKNCKHLVCVDYNFVNWYRSQISYIINELHVIPNFSQIPEYKKREESSNIKIIFARRFEEYRGTRIFTKVINNLQKRYNNVKITFAGDGSDKSWIKENIIFKEKVELIKYNAMESLEIHKKYDIAVVPTRGAEGTSLSLLEAMAAGCAVVSTYIGGLSNIVLDGYNGFLVEPEVEAVEKAIEKLIIDKNLREKFSQKGYETVKEVFSKEKWEEKWIKLINEINKK